MHMDLSHLCLFKHKWYLHKLLILYFLNQVVSKAPGVWYFLEGEGFSRSLYTTRCCNLILKASLLKTSLIKTFRTWSHIGSWSSYFLIFSNLVFLFRNEEPCHCQRLTMTWSMIFFNNKKIEDIMTYLKR